MALAAERQRKCIEYYKAGATFDQIARELGYRGASSAYRAFKAGLRKMMWTVGEDEYKMQVARYQHIILALWRELFVRETVNRVEIVDGKETVTPVEQQKLNLPILDRLERWLFAYTRLRGMEPPTKHQISGPDGGPVKIEHLNEPDRVVQIVQILQQAGVVPQADGRTPDISTAVAPSGTGESTRAPSDGNSRA